MKKNANYFGEKYRSKSFKVDEYGNNFGGYNTFEIEEDFIKLEKKSNEYQRIINLLLFQNDIGFINNTSNDNLINDYEEYQRIGNYDFIYFNKKIKLYIGLFWDGDGSLVFIDKKNRIFFNNDCKKDSNWDTLH